MSHLSLRLVVIWIGISLNTFGQNQMLSISSIRKADSLFLAGDYKSAKEMYSRILKDTSKNATAWSRYGFSNLNMKNYDEALRLLEKAISLHPPTPVRMNTFASMARIWSTKSNKPKALINLDSAITLGYSNLKSLDTSDDFKNIRDVQKFKDLRQRVYFTVFPCMSNTHAREFDFWIGDWDVYVTGTKNYAGHNKIEMVAGGCALLENWDSNASTGKSLNFIDPVTGKWKQTWTGSYASGIQDFTDGEYKDGAMRFVFEAVGSQGNKVMGRFVFYNEKPGQVRQFNETSLDRGKTWATNYDFTYILKK